MIGTLHGTKGLEADTIIIPEVNTYISDQDRQLLYVGMTRTKKKLILSANESTTLVKTLKDFQTSDLIWQTGQRCEPIKTYLSVVVKRFELKQSWAIYSFSE